MVSVMNATSGQRLAVRVTERKDDDRIIFEREENGSVSQNDSKAGLSSDYKTISVRPGAIAIRSNDVQ